MKSKIHIAILISTFSISSCMPIVKSIYGIKDPKLISDKQIVKTSKKFKVEQSANYSLDTSYFSFIMDLDTNKFKVERKNHIQPLQALYFDSEGQLVKFYINCYAGGFPNLNWNYDGNLETFLPKDQAPLDTIINFQKLAPFLKPVNRLSKVNELSNYDYYVVVFWTKCMKRHSKRLIKSIQENVSKAKSHKVKLIYVNNEHVFYKLENR